MLLFIEILQRVIRIYIFLIIIRSLLSWFSIGYNFWINLLYRITEPYLSFFRRLLPPMGGFDFSPILSIFALYFLEKLVIRLLLAL